MKGIKNIIFDLGAVLLNLEPERTEAAFAELVGDSEQHASIRKELFEKELFTKFETNEVLELEFVETIKAHHPHPLTDGQVRRAWSAMLLDLPEVRIELLRRLREAGYKVYLLSNINSIHLTDIYNMIEEVYGDLDFDALFDKPYYSHLIGRRKPDADTFSFVLEDAGLLATETLFIDDNADNVASATALGIHTIHHPANSDIVAALTNLLNL
jgi:HAD superfamily hydrolase (TIGR01509 family)